LLELDPGTVYGCWEAIASRQRNLASTAQALLQILRGGPSERRKGSPILVSQKLSGE
jgi:hypothetical protein